MSIKSPRPNDVAIGQNIRSARIQRKVSQTTLGNAIGVTFQQVQKYEKGTNRVGGSRMVEIANVLQVPVHELFPTHPVSTRRKYQPLLTATMLTNRVGMDVLEAWEQLTLPQRVALRALIIAMADANVAAGLK